MSRKWLLIILAGILILSLAACTGASGSPTQAPSIAEEDHDAAVDEADHDNDEETVSINAADIYSQRCSGCHGPERGGANGPALLPDTLTKDPSVYINTITNGSGPMPAFGNRLSADEISALVDFILGETE